MLDQRATMSGRATCGAGDDGANGVAEATTSRSAIGAVASHELRTPLNAIHGNLGLLLDGAVGPLSGDARACLADIQRAASRLRAWVEDLLVELDRRMPPRGAEDALDLVALVRDVLGSSAADLLALRPPDGRLEVWGPPAWLHATAMAMVELHVAIAPDLPLELERRCPAEGAAAELRVTWATFDLRQIEPSRLGLLTAIMARQGGWLISNEDGVHLYWPHRGGLQSAASGQVAEPPSGPSSLARP